MIELIKSIDGFLTIPVLYNLSYTDIILTAISSVFLTSYYIKRLDNKKSREENDENEQVNSV